MPNLIIGNPDNESMVGDVNRLTEHQRIESSIVAHRLTWLLDEGDAILLPYPISDAFLQYVCGLLQIDPYKVRVIIPPGCEHEAQQLTFELLANPESIHRIRNVLTQPAAWTVTPYFFDRSVAWLARELGMAVDENLRAFLRQGGADQLNSKVTFRRIAAGHEIPVAEGYICSSPAEFRASLRELIQVTGAAIVKQDLHSGGEGNIVVTTFAEENSTGAFETIRIGSPTELDGLSGQLWERLTGRGNTTLVAEAYYRGSVPYYSELEIPPGGRRPYLLNFGEMRMAPVWCGFEIPGQTLTLYQLGDFLANSMKLADVARSMGYAGKINCDAIRTSDGRILFTEINGRLGGCTHIHIAARRLFGSDYGSRYTILTRNRIPTCEFQALLALLDREGLLFTRARGKGAVILTEDTGRTGTVEYMVVAPDAAEAYDLEKATLRVFERSCAR